MKLVKDLQKWIDGYNEVKTLADELELSFDFYKEELVTEGDVDAAYAKASEAVEALELKNMLRDEADQMACVLKINSGAGGTESQDWASMLMRMYLRYAETNGYKATIANLQEGDEAGIKTCTINIEGDFAYGYLKGENGVHRLVRVSPYNAQGKRMTSFASVFVTPLVDDSIEVNILPACISWDTFRGRGSGGQDIVHQKDALSLHSLRPCHPEGTRHIGQPLVKGKSLLPPGGAGTDQRVCDHRNTHRPGKGLCHPLRHIVAALFAGGRYRKDAVVTPVKARYRFGQGLRTMHSDLAAKEQAGHLHAQLHSCPGRALIFRPQHRAADKAGVSVGRGCPIQPPQVVLGAAQPHGGCTAQLCQPIGAVRAGRPAAQHPVTKRAAARVKHPAQLPQCAAQAAVIKHQSFLTAMMTRTFFPAAQPKLSYQPVSW